MKFECYGGRYQDDLGREVFDVSVGNESLKGLIATKLNKTKCSNCNYSHRCSKSRVYRKYDCRLNRRILNIIYVAVTTLIVLVWSFCIFNYFKYNFFYQMSLLVLSITGFSIICTLVEEVVVKIYDWLFSLKLKKMLKLRKKEKAEEVAKAKAEEDNRIKNVPGYEGTKKAKALIQKFREISKQCDYGSNTSNIESCVQSCEVIMKILEKDTSEYYRVSDVFERYLPKVCTAIEMYKKSVDAKETTEQLEILFTKFIENASEYLSKKKNEAIYYNNGDELNLESSTDSLMKSLQEEKNNVEEA